MYVVSKDPEQPAQILIHDDKELVVIHIDRVTSKVHFVPHFDKDNQEQVCALSMWESI